MYRFLLLLHLVSAVAAFGPTLVLPLFTRQDPRAGAGQVTAVLQRVVTPGLVGLIVFGSGLVATVEGDRYSFSQAWVSLACLVLVPRQRRMVAARTEGDAARLARQSAGLFGALHLLLVIGLVLMVWKPG